VFPFELRADGDGDDDARIISGYAAVFDSESEPIGGRFREVIRSGAFKKTIQESDTRALWNHDSAMPLGRTANDTLELREDDHGLAFKLHLPDTTAGRDAYTSIQRGDVSNMSFGFNVIKEKWSGQASREGDEENTELRELLEVALHEISPVTFPAYTATEVEARTIESIIEARQPDDTTPEPGPAPHSEAGPHAIRLAHRKRQVQLLELEGSGTHANVERIGRRKSADRFGDAPTQ